MASDWPAFVALPMVAAIYEYGLIHDECPDGPLPEVIEGTPWSVYIHRDAARAWQAFRDFLNGVGEQGDMSKWQAVADQAYRDGRIMQRTLDGGTNPYEVKR